MKYNAVNHTIEFDDGRLAATLEPEVSSEAAYVAADWWEGADEDEVTDMVDDLRAVKRGLEDAAEEVDGVIKELSRK